MSLDDPSLSFPRIPLKCRFIFSLLNYFPSGWYLSLPEKLILLWVFCLVTHMDLRFWLTKLTWIWKDTMCPLGLICNIFKIHISGMVWVYGKTISPSFLEEHKSSWEFINFLDEREKSLWGRAKAVSIVNWDLTFSFLPGQFEQFIIKSPSVTLVFHVLRHSHQ